jgi:hypothetical protein
MQIAKPHSVWTKVLPQRVEALRAGCASRLLADFHDLREGFTCAR